MSAWVGADIGASNSRRRGAGDEGGVSEEGCVTEGLAIVGMILAAAQVWLALYPRNQTP